MLMNNKIDYISPFYKNPLINTCLGTCSICGNPVYQNGDYIKLGKDKYMHFDCYWIIKDFIEDSACDELEGN